MAGATWRRRWLAIALGGMDMAVLTALALLVSFWLGWSWSPWPVWVGLWLDFLFWTLMSAVLARWPLSLTLYRALFTLLILVTALGAVRLIFYPGLPWSNWAWLRETLFVVPFDWTPHPRLELVLMVTHGLVALRAAAMSDRNLYDRFVLESFLRALVTFCFLALTLEALGGVRLWPFLLVPLFSGSLAVLLARVDSRTAGAHTAGHSLTPRHWLALMGTQALDTALSWLSAPWLAGLAWRLLALLGTLLSAGFALLVAALLTLFQGLLPVLVSLFQGRPLPVPETPPGPPPQAVTPGPGGPTPPPAPWPETTLRTLQDLLQWGGGLLLFLLLFGLVSLVLQRVSRGRGRALGSEAERHEPFSLQAALGRLTHGLRETLEAVRQFGLGRSLLDVISVQNMYANICRLAAARGVPRAVNLSPDVYLGQLTALYPEVSEELALITRLYLRAHYGERTPTPEELEQARRAYGHILDCDRARE